MKEENRPWWGGRASNPVGGASRRRVGSTPILFRHASRRVGAARRGRHGLQRSSPSRHEQLSKGSTGIDARLGAAPVVTRIRGFDFPDDLFYLLEHDTWARLDVDGIATIGLTPLGAHISGEFIEFLPKPAGTAIERERSLGLLEMSKVIRAVRSPIAGVIVAANDRAKTQPGLINADPYGEGWLVRLRPTAWENDSALLVIGAKIPAAVEAYMRLLAETFGEAPP